MQKVLVDSNVILDIATLDPVWHDWSANALASCVERCAPVINPVIYAEVSVGFASIEEMSAAVPQSDFEYAQLPWEAAFLAGKCFLQYRKSGGSKRSPLPDFFIGAHATVNKMALLTRDNRRYRTYFPTVQLICPESN